MQDLQRRFESANQIAFLLGYLAPQLEPYQVRSLVDYLGDVFDPLVASLLRAQFAIAERPSPGLEVLREYAVDRETAIEKFWFKGCL
jgi:hypothetical protein